MQRKPDIAAALRQARSSAPPSSPAAGRAGKVGLTVYVDPDVRAQLKALAAEEHTSLQAVVFEALNMLLASRHRPEIVR